MIEDLSNNSYMLRARWIKIYSLGRGVMRKRFVILQIFFCILIFSSSAAAVLLDAIMMGGSITPPAEPDLHRQHAVRSLLLWIWAYRRANIKIYPQVFGWTTNVSWEIYPWHYYLFEYSSFDILASILYKLGYVKFGNDINLCPSFPTKFTSWEVRNSMMSLLYYSF